MKKAKKTDTAKVIAEALNHKELEKHYDKLLEIIIRNQGFTYKGNSYTVIKTTLVEEVEICIKCQKPFKQISEHTWQGNCEHTKHIRFSRG